MSPNGKVQERHQDYVWSFPTLNPGELMVAPFQTDPDAPFELRSMAARIPYTVAGTQDGLQDVSLRWSGPAENYLQQARVPAGLMLGAYFGQYGNPRPVFPSVPFPANSVTWVEVVNNGAAPLVGLQLFYRGVKLGRWGQWATYTYPEKMRSIPFSYPFVVPQLLQIEQRLGLPFRVKPNGDFVLRAGQAGRSFAPAVYEVFMRLRDVNSYPYSNAPVHVDILFGQSVGAAAYPAGPFFLNPVGPGASAPGLFYPEIYLPSDHLMLYDIFRNDAAYGGVTADFPVNLIGSKVVPA